MKTIPPHRTSVHPPLFSRLILSVLCLFPVAAAQRAAAAPPPAPNALAATGVTGIEFTARWSASTGADSYHLDVSTSNTFGSYVIGYENLNVGNNTSRTVGGLAANTTYYYRVRAYTGAEASGNSNAISVTTSSNTPVPPVALGGSGITSGGFTANWGAAPGATGYRLDVSIAANFGSYVAGYQDLDLGNVTSRNVGGLNPNTLCYYRVRAYNGSGTSGSSNTINVTTSAGPPLAPVALAASGTASSGFTANWSSSSNATAYHIDVSTTADFSSYVPGYQNLDVGNNTSRTVGGLAANTLYYYRVRAYNGADPSGNSNTINVTTSPNAPLPPVASAGSGITSGGFTANWAAAPGATGYRLDISTDSGFGSYVAGYQDLDVGNVTSRNVGGLNPDTLCYYRVRAYNASGTGGNSATISVRTSSVAIPPTARITEVIFESTPQRSFRFVVTGPGSLGITIQSSSDLRTWIDVGSGTIGPSGSQSFNDPAPRVGRCFYRIKP